MRAAISPGTSGRSLSATGRSALPPQARPNLKNRTRAVFGSLYEVTKFAGGGGLVVLWVGKTGKSPTVPNLRRKPYKIHKITDRKRPRKKKPPCPA